MKMKLIRKTRNTGTTFYNKSGEQDTKSPNIRWWGQVSNRHKTCMVLLSVGENEEVREAESDGLEEKRAQDRQVERTKERECEQEGKFKSQ